MNTNSQLIEAWTVWAYSPSLNQEIRQFNLEGNSTGSFTSQQEAEQWARAFAYSLGDRDYMRALDWQARVKFEQLGADTFVISQNSIITREQLS